MSGELYTPTTADVRSAAILLHTSFALSVPEFDRWLRAHDAEVARETILQFVDKLSQGVERNLIQTEENTK